MKTLKSSSDFQRISRVGKKYSSPAFIMLAAEGQGRVGYTASRKVGNAIVRNRAKRRLREVVRLAGGVPEGMDIVLIARTSAADREFTLLQKDFAAGLEKLR